MHGEEYYVIACIFPFYLKKSILNCYHSQFPRYLAKSNHYVSYMYLTSKKKSGLYLIEYLAKKKKSTTKVYVYTLSKITRFIFH